MKKLVKRYAFFIIMLVINAAILIFFPETGIKSLSITGSNALEMLSIVPPIFILLGLLDVWVKRETMVKIMGEKSSVIGIIIAFLLGAAAAGPLYAAFPVAGMLMKKGSKFSNVLIFVGSWSTVKIPMLLFEASSMGFAFMALRLALDIPVIIAMAYITDRALSKSYVKELYLRAEQMD